MVDQDQAIWTAGGYTTATEIETQVLQLYSYRSERKKVGWYYCPGFLHTLNYQQYIPRYHSFDLDFASNQIKVYKTTNSGKRIVIINGTTNLYYNLGEWIDHLEEMEDYTEHEPQFMVYDFSLDHDISYYRDACEIFRRELIKPYTSFDSTGVTKTVVAEMHSCHSCGYQNRWGRGLAQHCRKCGEEVFPYGVLIVHDYRLIDALLTAVGEETCHAISSKQFVDLVYPVLNRENQW